MGSDMIRYTELGKSAHTNDAFIEKHIDSKQESNNKQKRRNTTKHKTNYNTLPFPERDHNNYGKKINV